MYQRLIRPVLYRFDPEKIHHGVRTWLRRAYVIPGLNHLVESYYRNRDPHLARQIFGLNFPNPVGLSAGFDKGELFNELSSFGFGFIEIGTITPLPQNGNDKPRLFRLPKDEALINRMGFNNQGIKATIECLKKRRRFDVILGINIGKNKVTPLEDAVRDYEECFTRLFSYGDYFVVNVSSPNTPGLRTLQDKEPLRRILSALQTINAHAPHPKPLLLKISPDLSDAQLDDCIDLIQELKLSGIVATNTTLARDRLATDEGVVQSTGAGGLSGKPLFKRSTEIVHYISKKTSGTLPIIASGGVMSAADALEKLAAGATFVQVYTGFIYQGPGLIKAINQAILKNI